MTPEAAALAEISRQVPDAPVAYGVDHRGPWARVGLAAERAKTVEGALLAAMKKHIGGAPDASEAALMARRQGLGG